jgi:sterol desaturase/sphingolipid hydroxylase (fatty acid hydroxylase superfamily)
VFGFLFLVAIGVAFAGIATLMELPRSIEPIPLRSRLVGLGFMVVGGALGGWATWALAHLWQHLGVAPLLVVHSAALGTVGGIVAWLLLSDFAAYWNHRFQHRFLWPIHAVHHSQTELCAATSYTHFLEQPFRLLATGIPLSLVQFGFPAAPFAIIATRELLEFFIHSPTRLHFGPFAKVFVDNRFHRLHHSREPRHFDTNFGILFSFWDRLFGTAVEPVPGHWPAVGIEGHGPPRGLIDYMLFPLRFRREVMMRSADRRASDPVAGGTRSEVSAFL